MNIETIKFLKAITAAFGANDAVQFEQATWEKIHAGIEEAIAELESQEPVALEALVMICVKCRSNEWGPDTPRKQILNWFHDTASKALEDAQIFRGQA